MLTNPLLMIATWRQPVTKKLDLSKKLDVCRGSDRLGELPKNFLTVSSSGQILKKIRQENLRCLFGHQRSTNIPCLDFDIDRKLQDSFHEKEFKLTKLLSTLFSVIVRGRHLNYPSSPGRILQGLMKRSIIKCSR